MHLIGYWADRLEDHGFCFPQEITGELPDDVRTRVADYLDSGELFEIYRGLSWCRFECGTTFDHLGCAEKTDGTWAWPEGLSHYVRKHGIILPDDFVAHVLSSTPRSPKTDSLPQTPAEWAQWHANHSWPKASLNYWREWCAAHRSPTIAERVRRRWSEASEKSWASWKPRPEDVDRQVAGLIEQYGVGDERCSFFGCEQPVLLGMKLCARHTIRD